MLFDLGIQALMLSSEVPAAFSKYGTNKPAHEAGYDSYLTAIALIKLSARTDGSNELTVDPSSPTDNVDGSKRSNALSSVSSLEEDGVPVAATSHCKDPSSRNMLEILADLSLQETLETQSSKPVVHTMIPNTDSPFWLKYGNKLRVNGTQEEVCYIN